MVTTTSTTCELLRSLLNKFTLRHNFLGVVDAAPVQAHPLTTCFHVCVKIGFVRMLMMSICF